MNVGKDPEFFGAQIILLAESLKSEEKKKETNQFLRWAVHDDSTTCFSSSC